MHRAVDPMRRALRRMNRAGLPPRPLRKGPTPGPTVRAAALPLMILVVATGCDLPTSVPRWETAWELVVARDSVTTAQLLPEQMRVTPDGLVMDSFVVRDSVLLGDVCELCTCFDGPVPRLDLESTDHALRLPSRLLEADLERGTAFLRLTNGLGFDLLDDGLGNRGFLRARLIDLRSGVTLVDRVEGGPFPDGSTLEFEFPLDGVRAHSRLVARVTGTTPGSSCEELSLDPNDGLDVEVELRGLNARAATVLVLASDLAPAARRAALPSAIAERLGKDGAELIAELSLTSSLGVPVNLDLSVAGREIDLWKAAAALTTPVEIGAGSMEQPTRIVREYVMSPAMLATADSVLVAANASLPAGGVVVIRGAEGLSWDLRIRARVPSR